MQKGWTVGSSRKLLSPAPNARARPARARAARRARTGRTRTAPPRRHRPRRRAHAAPERGGRRRGAPRPSACPARSRPAGRRRGRRWPGSTRCTGACRASGRARAGRPSSRPAPAPRPGVHPFRADLRHLAAQLRRDQPRLLPVAPRDRDQAGVVGVRLEALLEAHLLQQLTDLVADEELVLEPADRRERLRAQLAAVARHHHERSHSRTRAATPTSWIRASSARSVLRASATASAS